MDKWPNYPNCNLPWIDTAVNSIAANTLATLPPKPTNPDQVAVDVTNFHYCCTAPGQCRPFDQITNLEECNLFGALDCQFGNSKYVCSYVAPPAGGTTTTTTAAAALPSPSLEDPIGGGGLPTDTTCLQEGTLAITRALPCCPPNASKFLKARTQRKLTETDPNKKPCLSIPTLSNDHLDSFCCLPGDNGQCGSTTTTTVPTEGAADEFSCGISDSANTQADYQYSTMHYGNKYVIFEAYRFGAFDQIQGFAELELACVEEIEFGSLVGNSTDFCAAVEKSSCNLGGGAVGKAPASVGPWTGGVGNGKVDNGGAGGGGGETSAAMGRKGGYGGGIVRKAAFSIAALFFVQMLC
ncbi:hypothetical protein BGW39_008380 [Mortierella sp. 14UC]|nr:hypothetical protein BGW39_008380 [Mortierella sp. 14UC]